MRLKNKQILVASVVACLGFASGAQAQALDVASGGGWRPPCSVQTLKGAYGVKLSGNVTSPVTVRLDAVSLMTFSVGANGLATFTSTTTGRVGGVPVPTIPYNGTYTVNANCTGKLSFAEAIGGVVKDVAFTIVDRGERGIGNEFFLVVDSAVAQISGEAERVNSVGDRH